MINPTELRIGNLLTTEWYDSYLDMMLVESINYKGINLDVQDDGNYQELAAHFIEPEYEFRKLYPIPITEELLLKLGAIKLDFKEYPSFNLKGIQINYIDSLWIEYVSRVEITGLHHLQNIFYFRNTEELDISVIYS